MSRRPPQQLVLASAIALVVTAALPGCGGGSSAGPGRSTQKLPAGLADAIHARLGVRELRSSSDSRGADGPFFGVSVALSADGTTALVGATNAGPLSTTFGRCCHWRAGEAFVFHVSDAGSWSSTDTPTATLQPGDAEGFGFGWDVALSEDGTTAFVAQRSNGGRGAIYVFHVDSEDAWASSSTPKATLTVASSIAYLGPLAVSSDGTTLVADSSDGDEYGGSARVFHASSEDAWATTGTPTATLNGGGGGEGVAISADGTTVLLSDSRDGGASIYHVSAEDAWTSSSTPNAVLSDANTAEIGAPVALSGDGTVALVGSSAGVDVFRAASAADWPSTSTPTATLTKAGGSKDDDFGSTVHLSGDGTTALMAPSGNATRRGDVYIFHVADEGAWASSSAPTATLTESGGDVKDQWGLGAALSADGVTALLGAPGVDKETGEADVFHVADASSWPTSSTSRQR